MYFAKKKKRKGFTLIELLVVIAIIGILATIVVVNVNSARNKAKDTTIIGSLDSLRNAGELSYSTDLNYNAVCLEVGTAVAGNSVLNTTAGSDYVRINTSVKAQNGNVDVVCNESANSAAYAAWTVLSTGAWYCVDSTGVSKNEPVLPIADSTACL